MKLVKTASGKHQIKISKKEFRDLVGNHNIRYLKVKSDINSKFDFKRIVVGYEQEWQASLGKSKLEQNEDYNFIVQYQD